MRDLTKLYNDAPHHLLAGDLRALLNLVKSIYPELIMDIRTCRTPRNPFHVIWEANPDVFCFGLQSFSLISFDAARIFSVRFFCMLDLFLLCQRSGCTGSTIIDLDDIGGGIGLRFCDNAELGKLIPDSDFFSSFGYNVFKENVFLVPWHQKKDLVLWRGSSTGLRGNGHFYNLPRIRLCLMASQQTDVFDCALTDLVQISDEEKTWVRSTGLMGQYVRSVDYPRYMYHIDIDGNSNAWSALFYKLLSGSVVLKVQSSENYSQWFYERLIPWENFVPVSGDLSDLLDIVERLRKDSDLAQRIASNGRALALSLDYESQLLVAKDRVIVALKEGAATMEGELQPEITYNGDQSASRLAVLLATAVERGQAEDGKVSDNVLAMPGMSGRNYRYTINNLVASVPNANYLEIGSWAGSTACAAMEGNKVRAVCIDNWSEFGGPKKEFLENTTAFRGPYADFLFIESDFRDVPFSTIGSFNLYLFDGPHGEKDQYDALSLVLPALEKEFVFIVDDWNWDHVRRGTMASISDNSLDVVFSVEIRTTLDNTHPVICQEKSRWHNGYFLAVIRRG